MKHLTSDQIYTVALDQKRLDPAAEQHLAECAECRRQVDDLLGLVNEFEVARRSQPSPSAIDYYTGLFRELQQRESGLSALWRTLRAQLSWDSRHNAALQGVRSGVVSAYRLLYTTRLADVEIMIEPDHRAFRVQGEVVSLSKDPVVPALVQWLDQDGVLRYETETDDDGRFQLRGVTAGSYRVVVVPLHGEIIEVQALEIM